MPMNCRTKMWVLHLHCYCHCFQIGPTVRLPQKYFLIWIIFSIPHLKTIIFLVHLTRQRSVMRTLAFPLTIHYVDVKTHQLPWKRTFHGYKTRCLLWGESISTALWVLRSALAFREYSTSLLQRDHGRILMHVTQEFICPPHPIIEGQTTDPCRRTNHSFLRESD